MKNGDLTGIENKSISFIVSKALNCRVSGTFRKADTRSATKGFSSRISGINGTVFVYKTYIELLKLTRPLMTTCSAVNSFQMIFNHSCGLVASKVRKEG